MAVDRLNRKVYTSHPFEIMKCETEAKQTHVCKPLQFEIVNRFF